MTWIKSLLLCALCSLALAQSQHQEPSIPLPEQGAQLVVWSIAPGIENLRQQFEKRFNLPVQARTFANGAELYKALEQALNRGEAVPDVARVEYAFLPWLNRTRGLLTMPDSLREYFAPWAVAQCSSFGVMTAIPQDIGALTYIYQRNIFERYKLTAPRTWSELQKTAASLYSQSKGQVKLLNFDPSSLFFAALVWAQGGRFWTQEQNGYIQTLDTPISRAAMSFWGGLIRQKQVSALPEYSLEYWNALRSGRLASAIVPTWALAAMVQNLEPAIAKGAEFQMVPLPSAGRASSANWGGSSFVVSKFSKYPNAATAFALYSSTSAEAITEMWTSEARLPAMNSGFNLPELATQSTIVFAENPVEIYAAASSQIPERFDFAPWLPAVDAVYRKLFMAALENRISFGQIPTLWQTQTLELARRSGFTVR
ncbi:MAG: extracellular solute-binding protein [Deinococcales bacterium]